MSFKLIGIMFLSAKWLYKVKRMISFCSKFSFIREPLSLMP